MIAYSLSSRLGSWTAALANNRFHHTKQIGGWREMGGRITFHLYLTVHIYPSKTELTGIV